MTTARLVAIVFFAVGVPALFTALAIADELRRKFRGPELGGADRAGESSPEQPPSSSLRSWPAWCWRCNGTCRVYERGDGNLDS